MNRLSRLIAFLVYLLTGFQCVIAQNAAYSFSRLDINSGLSHNRITSILKDEKGFLWFGTSNGLNRFDGYKFKVYKHRSGPNGSLSDNFIGNIFNAPGDRIWVKTQSSYAIYDPDSDDFLADLPSVLKLWGLPDSRIQKVIKGENGRYYFLHSVFGLYIYDSEASKTTHFGFLKGALNSLHSNNATDITIDAAGNVWIIYQDGFIEQLNPKSGKLTFKKQLIGQGTDSKQPDFFNLYADKQNDLWVYSVTRPLGVFYFNRKKNEVLALNRDAEKSRLNSNMVNAVVQDDAGKIWIATDHGGVNILDKNNRKVTYLINEENSPATVSQNSIISMFKDPQGVIWLGTYKKGISFYHPNIIKFPLYNRRTNKQNRLNFDDVNTFAEDAKGNLWIGTNGGGLIHFNRQTGIFKSYLNQKSNSNSLSNNIVISLCVDHEQKLWIGTYFGGLDCFDGKTFKHYRHSDTDSQSISDDRIYEVLEDSDRNIWAGTLGGGLNKLDRKTGKFISFKQNAPNSIHSNFVYSIIEDKSKNLWLGTTDGVEMLQKSTGKFIQYQHSSNPNSLANNNVYSLIADSRGYIWIATHEGLSVLKPKTNQIINFTTDDGLPENNIVAIRESKDHNLWLSTASGLSNLIITDAEKLKIRIINYDEKDGLQGREFNEDASYVTRKGELIFGGSNGFNLFDPATIRQASSAQQVLLTDFQLFNKSVNPGEMVNGKVILPTSITGLKSMVLNYDQNFFSIEFASLNFLNPEKVKHQFMIEGLDNNWVTADNKVRKATYTNLDPGSYVFKVKASSNQGTQNEQIVSLSIEILPPWWKTKLAYFLYLAVFISGLFYLRYRGIQKISAQFALEQAQQEAQRLIEQERQEAQRMHELDKMKIKFLTNVSHEFRTPLSLIIAPVDRMLKNPDAPVKTEQVTLIKRNAKRLLNLVNQLLDFRKMEVQELKLDLKAGDIISFVKDVSLSFNDIASQNKLKFEFDTDQESLLTLFDHDKIERILFNLLSNAFKFTPSGGRVSVILHAEHTNYQRDEVLLKINVIDTGIGIPTDKQDKIFERFFQNEVPASMINQGSGIGLSITREFVKMHQGEISVEDVATGGSCFIVELPLLIIKNVTVNSADTEKEILSEDSLVITGEIPALPVSKKINQSKLPTILLVEDNDDFRFYLKDNLQENFQMLEAVNGKEGWQKALALHPDLIVSDISMPEMSGLELCAKIKKDTRTAHIPVILLTALMEEDDQMKGLETGANDYLTKPFNFEILQFKIKNLLDMRVSFKTTYSKQIGVQVQGITVPSLDEKFVNNALGFIEKNLHNPNLSVEELSKHMCMSRVSLYKKLLLLTGKTPVDFIRFVRLEKARQLLETSKLNIAEVCYQVGFNTPTYFSKSFKAAYHVLPSEYVNQFKTSGESS